MPAETVNRENATETEGAPPARTRGGRACDGCGQSGRWFWERWCDRCVPEPVVAKRGAALLAARDGAEASRAPEEEVRAGRMVQAVHGAEGLSERNLEELVLDFLEWLGHPRGRLMLQVNGADIAVLHEGSTREAPRAVMVVEVKRSLREKRNRSEAVRQAFDYAGRLGAQRVVITDADRYEVFDRNGGLSYGEMQRGAMRLTRFEEANGGVLRMLAPGGSRAVPGPVRMAETGNVSEGSESRPGPGTARLTPEAGPRLVHPTPVSPAGGPSLTITNYLTGRQIYRRVAPPAPPAPPLARALSGVAAEEVRWLWRGLIPRGKLTVLSGDPGVGKSFLTMALAARVSAGRAMPGEASGGADGLPASGEVTGDPGDVVLLSAEDDAADTVRPRLAAMGGDAGRVHVVGASESGEPFSLVEHVPELDRFVGTLASPRLVVIDPVSAFLGTAESYNNAQVRALLGPLVRMAAGRGVAVVLVTHLRKGSPGRGVHGALQGVAGSLAITAAARVVLSVRRDAGDDARRLVRVVKSNVGRDGVGYAFRVVDGGVEFEALDSRQDRVAAPGEEIVASGRAVPARAPRMRAGLAGRRGPEWRAAVGRAIREERLARRMGQTEVGGLAGVSGTHVSRIETHGVGSDGAIRAVARALDIDVDSLDVGEESELNGGAERLGPAGGHHVRLDGQGRLAP